MYPAESLAAMLKKRRKNVMLFTDQRGLDNYNGMLKDLPTVVIKAGNITGQTFKKMAININNLGLGFVHAFVQLRKAKPGVVVGFGGYASAPTVLAALILRIPVVLHEQNSVLGRVNRLFGKFVRCIAVSYPQTKLLPVGVDANMTGMPVRQEIKDLGAKAVYKAPGDKINIIVTGGSQGAAVLAKTFARAFAGMPKEIRKKLNIVQQCPEKEIADVQEIYDEASMDVQLTTFIQDMPKQLASAHLVMARAGASTIAELQVLGRPAVLVPFAQAADDHQSFNAKFLEKSQAAWVIKQSEFTVDSLDKLLEKILGSPALMETVAANIKKLARPDADEALANLVLAVQ
ncbi:MAG: undecaprenyldiphospho-muramoylpentapeptide beta-N-acetylglucosaminyltransferase [Alphaproteobacteria bacterium]|nr:undecaprenyldiphospho-muramoylpentapeptide beta-N-acetylglucosaminyltransferase [Alphaproteobacteria bacterium]